MAVRRRASSPRSVEPWMVVRSAMVGIDVRGSSNLASLGRRALLLRLLAAALAAPFVAPSTGVGADGAIAVATRHPRLVRLAHALLARHASGALARFLRAWPDTIARRDVSPATLPVLRYLESAVHGAPRAAQAVARELLATAGSLCWRQTYTPAQVSEQFLENYGWTELLGLAGEVPSERLALGFLLLGPETDYPRHAHPAEEIYVPLLGTARWWTEATGWHAVAPLVPVLHEANEAHAMHTGPEPLLALYLWHGEHLGDKSHLT